MSETIRLDGVEVALNADAIAALFAERKHQYEELRGRFDAMGLELEKEKAAMSSLAEFERDLLRERVRSGLAAAKARGKILGRKPGENPKSDRLASKVMDLIQAGDSYRQIADEVKLNKDIVMAIVKRNNAKELQN